MPISLSLPLREDRYVGAPVIAVFENLLPDSDLIRRRVAERVGAQGIDSFSLLSEIGRDCVGALQFLPDGHEQQSNAKLTGETISTEQFGDLLNGLDIAPLGIRKETDFRISVAGAQEKTALLFHNNKWLKPMGTTPTTHIIKPQIGKLHNGMDLSNSVENEYLCLKLMEAFGLRVANAEIAQFGNRKALVVERFDRQWTKDGRLLRLPQENCCQALSVPPTQKYQSEGGPEITEIMDLLRSSDEPTKDRLDFFKTNILFWLIGATDGHAKNFSLGLFPEGRFRMTPLYDILTAQPTFDAKQISHRDYKLAMKFGKSGHYKIFDILSRHIKETGQNSGLSQGVIIQIFEDIHQNARTVLNKVSSELLKKIPSILIDSIAVAIEERLKRLS